MTSDRNDRAWLADLDAGLAGGLDDDATAARLRAQAAADPGAAAVLAALATTRAELAALPPVPVPEAAAARWAGLFEAQAPARPLHRRRPRVLGRVAVAAAIAGIALLSVGLGGRGSSGPELALSTPQLATVGRGALGVGEAGALGDPARRTACLRHVRPGHAADAPLLGARQVALDGVPGVLLVLGTGRLGTFDVVVVDPGCDAADGTLLAELRVP